YSLRYDASAVIHPEFRQQAICINPACTEEEVGGVAGEEDDSPNQTLSTVSVRPRLCDCHSGGPPPLEVPCKGKCSRHIASKFERFG
ncbi:UNVERIFIED_CONTAM: hypothetical protein NCL1_59657, partial [Trichonephila clavipes]